MIASAIWYSVFQRNLAHLLSVVISNKSARICETIFGHTVIQSLKSGKAQKIGFISMGRQENLADLFLIVPGQLQSV